MDPMTAQNTTVIARRNARVLLDQLLRSGDNATLSLGPEASDAIAVLREGGLVEIESQGSTTLIRLKRVSPSAPPSLS